MIYADVLLDYFYHTEHAGVLDLKDQHGIMASVGGMDSDAAITVTVQHRDGVIQQALFQAKGAPPVLAAAEFFCRYLEGQALKSLPALTTADVLDALALPKVYVHVAQLVLQLEENIGQGNGR